MVCTNEERRLEWDRAQRATRIKEDPWAFGPADLHSFQVSFFIDCTNLAQEKGEQYGEPECALANHVEAGGMDSLVVHLIEALFRIKRWKELGYPEGWGIPDICRDIANFASFTGIQHEREGRK